MPLKENPAYKPGKQMDPGYTAERKKITTTDQLFKQPPEQRKMLKNDLGVPPHSSPYPGVGRIKDNISHRMVRGTGKA